MSFIAELKRRNVIRMAGLYLVGAWLLVQVAETILPAFDVPNWVMRALIIMLALGFVPAVIFAWVFELTPGGIKRDEEVDPAKSIAPQTAQRMNLMIIVLLVVALGYFAFDKFVLAPRHEAALSAQVTVPDKQIAHKDLAEQTIPATSIAVLAFADLSPQHDKSYFSDGIAEELLNALAKVNGLKVAGRTSSFQFKGKNEDLRSIGKVLGVANVLEGSVRTQGDKVRISAQLIRTQDGFQLWSQAYDGDLKDVFALQEKIARKITDQLQVVLSGKQAERLVDAGTRNPEAYALYLQATATFNRRDGARFDEAMEQLRQAVAMDPKFARAYSRMATLDAVRASYAASNFETSMHDAERFARKASELDPQLAEPHAALSVVYISQRRYRDGRREMARALALDPNDVTTNFWNGVDLIMLGYRKQGTAALDRVLQIDPLLPNALAWRASIHIANGELDAAERQLQRAAEGGHAFVGLMQYKLDLARGKRAAAVKSLTTGLTYFAQGFPPEATGIFTRSCLGDVNARREATRLIDDYLAKKPKVLSAIVPWVLVNSGEVGRGFALAESSPTNNDAMLMSNIFNSGDPVILSTPAFAQFVRKIGLADYWDEFGPPDFCRKYDAGDYVCAESQPASFSSSVAAR